MNYRFKIKDGWTKHVLRVGMAGLVPDNILWRKVKLGFEAPEAAWIKAASPSMKSAINQSAILNRMRKHKLNFENIDRVTFWKLYSIAKWEEVYSVQLAGTGTHVLSRQGRTSAPRDLQHDTTAYMNPDVNARHCHQC
jgi:asparagine synthase (glutamine-hydrolysing)